VVVSPQVKEKIYGQRESGRCPTTWKDSEITPASDSSFGENDIFGQAAPDTRTSIFRPGQFANSAHSEASTQTRNLHACVNPLQRLGSSPLRIHETWRTDSRGRRCGG